MRRSERKALANILEPYMELCDAFVDATEVTSESLLNRTPVSVKETVWVKWHNESARITHSLDRIVIKSGISMGLVNHCKTMNGGVPARAKLSTCVLNLSGVERNTMPDYYHFFPDMLDKSRKAYNFSLGKNLRSASQIMDLQTAVNVLTNELYWLTTNP